MSDVDDFVRGVVAAHQGEPRPDVPAAAAGYDLAGAVTDTMVIVGDLERDVQTILASSSSANGAAGAPAPAVSPPATEAPTPAAPSQPETPGGIVPPTPALPDSPQTGSPDGDQPPHPSTLPLTPEQEAEQAEAVSGPVTSSNVPGDGSPAGAVEAPEAAAQPASPINTAAAAEAIARGDNPASLPAGADAAVEAEDPGAPLEPVPGPVQAAATDPAVTGAPDAEAAALAIGASLPLQEVKLSGDSEPIPPAEATDPLPTGGLAPEPVLSPDEVKLTSEPGPSAPPVGDGA